MYLESNKLGDFFDILKMMACDCYAVRNMDRTNAIPIEIQEEGESLRISLGIENIGAYELD